MRWMLLFVGTVGCYTPPEVTVDVRVDIGPCGEPTRQVLMSTAPGQTVSLFRDDELISEHETDDTGSVTVRWPDTSMAGVQARVGKPDHYTAVDLVPPAAELYPVWREGRVAMNVCPGLANCGVTVSGATLQAQTPFSIAPELWVHGEPVGGMTARLTREHLADWRFPVIQDTEACAHLEGPVVRVVLPTHEPAYEGRLWWSKQQALAAVADVVSDDAGATVPTGSAVLVVESRTPVQASPSTVTRVFGELTQVSDVAGVIALSVTESHPIAACADDTAKHAWSVQAERIDVATGERQTARVDSPHSTCKGPTDLPMDPQPWIDEAIAAVSGD